MEGQCASIIINTNKTVCEFCFESFLTKKANRHYNSLKYKKNCRLTFVSSINSIYNSNSINK